MKIFRSIAIALALLLTLTAQVAEATQTVILASGHSAATSSDVSVASTATLTMFPATDPSLRIDLPVYFVANSNEIYIGSLSPQNPKMVLTMPGTVRVKRPVYPATGYDVGVTSDQGASGGAVTGTVGIDQTTPGTTNGVVVNSSALPTGAATSAKQPALGTAGTASADVLTVQGRASMTPLLVDGSATTQPVSSATLATAANQTTANTSLSTVATNTAPLIYAQGSTTSGQTGPLAQGSVTTAAPTYTNGQTNPLSLTTGGAVRADLASILGTALQVNNGVANSGVPRVVVGSSNSALPAWGHGATAAAVPAGATYAGAGVVTSIQTAASSGNLIGLTADHNGQLLVSPHPRELTKLQATSLATTGETTVVTAGASGVFNDITDVLITTAGTAAGTLAFKDATAGTTIFTINFPDAALAPSGAFEWKPARPIPQTTAANNWTVTASNAQAYNITIMYDQTK